VNVGVPGAGFFFGKYYSQSLPNKKKQNWLTVKSQVLP
jgi:hypothetical protein